MIDQPLTILYVENDPNDVLLLKIACDKIKLPLNLFSVSDGEKAQAYLARKGVYADVQRYPWPDLVLMDLKMPRRSGFEVTEWIRAHPDLRGLPVVIFTSSEQPDDRSVALDSGATGFYIKPIGLEDLENVMREIAHEYLHLPLPAS